MFHLPEAYSTNIFFKVPNLYLKISCPPKISPHTLGNDSLTEQTQEVRGKI
jgi:hypothetical protein